MKKITLRSLVSLLALGVFVFLAFGSSEGEKEVQKKVENEAPAFSTNAPQLWDDYKDNEVAADEKYKGKVIEVSGVIDSIGKDITDTMYVVLKGDKYIGGVQCFFAKEHAASLSKLKKGQQLTTKCRCEGKMMNIVMKGCAL